MSSLRYDLHWYPSGDRSGLTSAVPQQLGSSGINGLFRHHFFDGRYLDGKTLASEQLYWDARVRLRDSGSGIDEGLHVSGSRDVGSPKPPGFLLADTFTLSAGIATDPFGRTIVVPFPHPFTVAELLRAYAHQPTIAVVSDTGFSPCPRLAPDPEDSVLTTAVPPDGPYLLVIRAEERPEGEAKVYGAVCPEDERRECRTDGWRSGFGLSLSRYPNPLNDSEQRADGWPLRSLMASHFFNSWLGKRWTSGWVSERATWEIPSTTGDGTGPVALGVFYLREGRIAFFDDWMVRRPRVALAASVRAAAARGAPSPPEVISRSHQFQVQLLERLEARGVAGADQLYKLGFRCLPPYGFLPVGPLPPPTADQDATTRRKFEGRLLAQVATRVREFLSGLNILYSLEVCWRDDDVLRRIDEAAPLDPVCLVDPAQGPRFDGGELDGTLTMLDTAEHRHLAARERLASLLRSAVSGVSPHDALNRRIELLRVIVPLEGLSRRVAGVVGLTTATDLDARPRDFVVYVKEESNVLLWTWLAVVTLKAFPNAFSAAFWSLGWATSSGDLDSFLNGLGVPELVEYLRSIRAALGDGGFRRFMEEMKELSGV